MSYLVVASTAFDELPLATFDAEQDAVDFAKAVVAQGHKHKAVIASLASLSRDETKDVVCTLVIRFAGGLPTTSRMFEMDVADVEVVESFR